MHQAQRRGHLGRLRASWLKGSALLSLALSLQACANPDQGAGALAEVRDGQLFTCYRGQRMAATMSGTTLVVEGDIAVGPADQWCDESSPEIGVKRQAARIQGAQFNWPNGVVPYVFGSDSDATDSDGDGTVEPAERAANFTAAEQAAIVAALADWSAVVPGLTFRVATASDTDRIRFEPDLNGCNSHVGRQTNAQTINYTDGCVGTFSVHHEVGHALGLFHHHSRTDRDSFVTINWGNIKGCTAGATSSAGCGATACAGNLAGCGCTNADVTNGTCYTAGNFAISTASAAIFAYDYDSVMHYGPTAFLKTGLAAGSQTISPRSAAPTLGQRNHLSALDVDSMRALYPRFQNRTTVLVSTGVPAIVCGLLGREQDAATTYQRNGAGSFTFAGNRRTFTSYVGVQTEAQSCQARSNFWLGTYQYPNADTSRFGSESAAGDETFSAASSNVTFMNVALLPTLGI